MRRIFWLVLLVAAIHGPALAQTESIDVLRPMFDYEKNAALDIKEVGVINRKNVRIHDITYASPKSGRVTAYLVVPGRRGRFAGVVFGHWGYGTRTEFLPEAILYAQAGVVSLLVDDLGVRPAPWRRNAPGSDPEAVRENFIQSAVDLRRGIDVLQSRTEVDPNRIAYVGHSSGAHWGAILSAVDRRLKTVVLMAGVPSEKTILLESNNPDWVGFRQSTPKEQLENYFRIARSITCLTPDQRLCCFSSRASSNTSMKRRCSSTRERQANPNSFCGMTLDTH